MTIILISYIVAINILLYISIIRLLGAPFLKSIIRCSKTIYLVLTIYIKSSNLVPINT
jgi:hypothetical protein